MSNYRNILVQFPLNEAYLEYSESICFSVDLDSLFKQRMRCDCDNESGTQFSWALVKYDNMLDSINPLKITEISYRVLLEGSTIIHGLFKDGVFVSGQKIHHHTNKRNGTSIQYWEGTNPLKKEIIRLDPHNQTFPGFSLENRGIINKIYDQSGGYLSSLDKIQLQKDLFTHERYDFFQGPFRYTTIHEQYKQRHIIEGPQSCHLNLVDKKSRF